MPRVKGIGRKQKKSRPPLASIPVNASAVESPALQPDQEAPDEWLRELVLAVADEAVYLQKARDDLFMVYAAKTTAYAQALWTIIHFGIS